MICKSLWIQEWEKARKEESKQLAKQRQLEAEAEAEKEAGYRNIGNKLKDFPEEEVKEARKFVASLIKSGEEVEEVRFNWIFRCYFNF